MLGWDVRMKIASSRVVFAGILGIFLAVQVEADPLDSSVEKQHFAKIEEPTKSHPEAIKEDANAIGNANETSSPEEEIDELSAFYRYYHKNKKLNPEKWAAFHSDGGIRHLRLIKNMIHFLNTYHGYSLSLADHDELLSIFELKMKEQAKRISRPIPNKSHAMIVIDDNNDYSIHFIAHMLSDPEKALDGMTAYLELLDSGRAERVAVEDDLSYDDFEVDQKRQKKLEKKKNGNKRYFRKIQHGCGKNKKEGLSQSAKSLEPKQRSSAHRGDHRIDSLLKKKRINSRRHRQAFAP